MTEYRVRVYCNRTVWRNLDDERHREEGPAVVWDDGSKRYYLNGVYLSEAEWKRRTQPKSDTLIQAEELEMQAEKILNKAKVLRQKMEVEG